MLQAFSEAIGFLRQRPLALVGMGIIVLLQAGIALLQLPVANYFITNLDFVALVGAFDAVQLIGFVLLGLIGLVLNFSGFLWIAQQVKNWKIHSSEKASLQLLKSSGIVTLAIVFAAGIFLAITWLLSWIMGWIGFLGFFLLGVLMLVGIYLILKFSLTIPLMGFGLGIKQALQQSWQITQKHFFSVIAVLVGIFIHTNLVDLIVVLAVNQIDNEIIGLLLNFVSATFLFAYGAAVLACMIPLDEWQANPLLAKHLHGRGTIK